jgi:SAM-dependent methyltransferase
MSPMIDDAPPEELADVQAGRLPARYAYRMQDIFIERLRPLLVPGVRILDVGSGRSPTLSPADRPDGCRYIGLDISGDELDAAGPDAYDEAYAHDIGEPLREVRDVDVIISWQVLEHVSSMPAALANLRAVLAPGGTMLAQFSGTFAAFALASRVMPHRLRVWAMARYLGHAEELKFPTHFDHCYARALTKLTSGWASSELIPFYRGAPYFSMARPLQRVYLGYEDFIAVHGVESLATHYLLIARA